MMFLSPALPFAPVLTGKALEVSGAAFQSGFLVTPGLSLTGETK